MAKADHIYVNRDLYTHHGIDCGDGTAIHYSGERLRGIISRTSIETFSSGKPILLRHYPFCDPPELVIQRAESRLGENQYNLFFNNCEHFATWCKTGHHESQQVNQAAQVTKTILETGVSFTQMNIKTTSVISDEIIVKLKAGKFTRLGGVIFDTETKQVIAWLRQTNPNIPAVSNLLQIGASASILSLGVTVIGFAILTQRLNELEKKLKQAQELLNKINYKIDLGYYANFRAALELATTALAIENIETRKNMAIQAIGELKKADHIYTDYADQELNKKSPVIEEYLLTLILTYVAEARCYFELEALDIALDFLNKKTEKLRPRVQKYIELLLTENPAAYLHPHFKDKIDLRRLTKIYQWLDPKLDENGVFEIQRQNIWNFTTNSFDWAKKLPAAVFIDDVDWGIFSSNLTPGQYQEAVKKKAFSSLTNSIIKIESIIENYNRFESFKTEIKAMKKFGMSFSEWSRLHLTNQEINKEKSSFMCIILPEPLEL